MGICGTGMASLAGLFQERGYRVTGSDQAAYPPMSDFLSGLGIAVMEGYRAENLDPRPDIVIVGNVIRRTNPEARALELSGIPYGSMPEALNRFFAANARRIVVAGTHGKTTVSSMIAWILQHLGREPGFMIGGLPLNFGTNHRLGSGEVFVLEGDEYDTAYFDKQPKFLHYAPDVAVITSCEFDHGDIYRDLDRIKNRFREFAELVPEDGRIIRFAGDPNVTDVTANALCSMEDYGATGTGRWCIERLDVNGAGIHVTVTRDGTRVAQGYLPIMGIHNALNALAATAAAHSVGIDPQAALDALGLFKGVGRRQEIAGEEQGILVIDDFAHHPTEVRATLSAVGSAYPNRRLIAVFEPRTNTSKTSIFQDLYALSFPHANLVAIREPRDIDGIPPENRFSADRLARALRSAGTRAHAFPDTDGILEFLSEELQYEDVVVMMSNGNFDNLKPRLLKELKERSHEGSATV